MRYVILVLTLFCLLGNYVVYSETALDDSLHFYWIEWDWETEENCLMTMDEQGAFTTVAHLGDGYLIEGGAGQNAYYATVDDKDMARIHELHSGNVIQTICDPDLVRVLAYHGSVVYYIRLEANCPILIALDSKGDVRRYPAGKYYSHYNDSWQEKNFAEFAEFGLEFSEHGYTLHLFDATVSADGKIAYSKTERKESVPSSVYTETNWSRSVYYSTEDVADVYIGAGHSPMWLNDETLLYIGSDHKLYQHSFVSGESTIFLTLEGKELSLEGVDSEMRSAICGEEYIAYIKTLSKTRQIFLCSMKTGDEVRVERIQPALFSDAVWLIIAG